MLTLTAALFCVLSSAVPDPTVTKDGWVWVEGHWSAPAEWVEPFYREPSRPGLTWVEPTVEGQRYVGGHWRPVSVRPGQVWVRGSRTESGLWIAGFWRQAQLPGFTWVAGRRAEDGRWLSGGWQPDKGKKGWIWVSGHVGPGNTWVRGAWRKAAVKDHVWTSAKVVGGVWRLGYWSPTKLQAGKIWVPGVRDGDTIQVGSWRDATKDGHLWVPAHYKQGTGDMVAGAWEPEGWLAPKEMVTVAYAGHDHTAGLGQPDPSPRLYAVNTVIEQPAAAVAGKPAAKPGRRPTSRPSGPAGSGRAAARPGLRPGGRPAGTRPGTRPGRR